MTAPKAIVFDLYGTLYKDHRFSENKTHHSFPVVVSKEANFFHDHKGSRVVGQETSLFEMGVGVRFANGIGRQVEVTSTR